MLFYTNYFSLMDLYLTFILLFSHHLFLPSHARIHKLTIENDSRKYIALSTFGFYKGGILDVKLSNFHADTFHDNDLFGFSLDRTLIDAMNPFLETHQDKCLLGTPFSGGLYSPPIYFTIDKKDMRLTVQYSSTKDPIPISIFRNADSIPLLRSKRDSLSDQMIFRIRSLQSDGIVDNHVMPILPLNETKPDHYNASFAIYVASEKDEGLYNLYFHNCPNYNGKKVSVGFTIEIEEKNKENYLSAGEMPLPALYFMMSVLFFLSGCFWVFILMKSKHTVFKIHVLMGILVYLKSLSLLFHSINFHFIQTKGEHVAAWAILFYITHLLKGCILFITIVLIGTGWTFIKHILSEKDKKIFMIVIPLQVLENVAKIIIEESEEGAAEHNAWLDIFLYVDVLCCGAILLPVIWSIKHLQDASHTDGKAATNLRKLRLFRNFHIMIVCYIYFTRIIVYFLQITVSFQYKWLDEMFREMVTFVFFVLTGYMFRPASANPYFQLYPQDLDNGDMTDIVVSECGLTEGLSKLSRISAESGAEDSQLLLPSNRESSHEYD